MKNISRMLIALILTIGIFAIGINVKADEIKVTAGATDEETMDNYTACISTEGATCVLETDITNSGYYAAADNLTIKLNGHTISGNGTLLTEWKSGGTLNIVGPGTMETTGTSNVGVIIVFGGTSDEANFSTLNITNNAIIKNANGWGVYIQNQTVKDPNTNQNTYPAYGATINIEDSKIESNDGVTILGNFQDIDAQNPPVINLKNAIIAANETTGTGLYAAGFGLYNITDSTISGGSNALGIKSGTITVKNSKLYATGDYVSEVEGNNNGINKSGSTVQIELNDGYADHIKLYLDKTEVNSTNGHAFYQYLAKEDTSLSEVKELKITDCDISSKQNNFKVSTNFSMTKFIEGGSFNKEIDRKYIATGYTLYNVGSNYKVAKTEAIEAKTLVLKVGESANMHSNTPEFVGYNLFIPVDVFDSFGEDEAALKAYTDKLSAVASIDEKTGKVTAKKAGSVSYELHLTDFSDMENVPSALVTIVVLEDAKIVNDDKDVELVEDNADKTLNIVNEEISKVVTEALEVEDEKELTEMQKNIKEAVLAGKTVSAEVTSEKIEVKDLDKDIVKKIEAKEKEVGTIAAYFDISIDVTADGEKIGELNELNKKIKVTIKLPELPKLKDGETRTYNIIRVHNGEVTVLKATDNGDGTVSFESDKYSTYALTYSDAAKEDTTKKLDDTPDTGKTIAVIGLAMMGASIALVYALKRKNA